MRCSRRNAPSAHSLALGEFDHPVDRTLGTARTDAPAELAALAADGALKVAALRRGHRTSPSRARREPVFERRRHQRQAEEELEGRAWRTSMR
jgi:hypothetical protein